jgi:archaeal chaperonin
MSPAARAPARTVKSGAGLRAAVAPEEPADARELAAQVAAWAEAFLASSYGPAGGLKLVEQPDGHGRLVRSGADALREAAITHPDLQPHVDLAAAVAAVAGDQATLAGLVCARLVRTAVASAGRGLPVAASMEGYRLALRQVRAQLAALALTDPDGASLASVVPGRREWARLAWEGLRAMAGPDGSVALDRIDVRPEPGPAQWLEGVVAEPQHRPDPAPSEARVLVVVEEWKPGPWREGLSYRMTAAHGLGAWSGMEDGRRRDVVDRVAGLGTTLLVCLRGLDEEVGQRLRSRGVLVWTDAPESVAHRLRAATGARQVARLEHATAADLGHGTLRPRPRARGGFLVTGQGPSWTLCVPAETGLGRGEAADAAERLLRAAGILLGDPVRLPGGGRWQRQVAAGLRQAADAAPGKAPVAVRAAADAIDAAADDLVRNAGLDPLRHPLLPDAQEVWDVAGSVRIALVAAIEAAIQMLRIDGHYRRRESSSAWLRGGDKKVPKSLREMGGDIPPLM